jgi:hypothetical protein
MKTLTGIAALVLLSSSVSTAYAYSSGGSSSQHCDKPLFSEFEPAANKYVQSFMEFSMVASSNTAPNSIVVNISSGEYQRHFDHSNLEITPLKNGKFEISGKIERPIEKGFVRISVTAHSKPTCEKTDGYLLRIY